MRIGLLETGKVDAEIATRHGTYPEMFERLLAPAIEGIRLETVPVSAGTLPASPEDADAWLVIGSKHGVYDPLPWIAPLAGFLRAARAARKPIVGVCFGHQIVAEAFGGRAEKAETGWCLGVQHYDLLARPGWMADAPDSLAFHAHHQDQITALAPGTVRLAESATCPHAMVAYGDPERPDAVTIQAHPEFAEGYARALVEQRRDKSAIPDEAAGAALASYGQRVDNAAFAGWIRAYLGNAVTSPV